MVGIILLNVNLNACICVGFGETEIQFWYSILFFFDKGSEKSKVFLCPDDSVPDSHERYSKEESKSSSDLGNHRGRGVEKFFSLHRGVPGWNKQNADKGISSPCLSKKRKDKMIVEGGRDASSVDLVLQVISRLSTASHSLDHLKFFVLQLVVNPLKFPEDDFSGLK